MISQDVSPPVAPYDQSTRARVLRGIATFGMFAAFAGTFWMNLFTIWGYTVVAVITGGAALACLIVARPTIIRSRLPKSLIAYGALAVLSLVWSAYPLGSAATLVGAALCTILGVFVATCFDWPEIIRIIANALKWVLALSILFELVVSVFVRHPVLPFFVDFGDKKPPLLAYWSRDLLFEGGRIQGIQGNANLLAIITAFAIVVFALQLAARSAGRKATIFWLALAVVEFLLSFSTTILLAVVVAAVVLVAALLIRRAPTPSARTPIYLGFVGVIAVAVAVGAVFHSQLLALLGKSPDLTGRLDIWSTVWGLVVQRPVFGWGFSSPWTPWQPPFDDLVIRRGVVQLQAHNAWLDVWLQLGIIGLVLFAAVILSILTRTWFLAVDRPRIDHNDQRPYTALSLAPLLIATVLVVQSLAESRILTESGWVLVVLLALGTKQSPGWPVPVGAASSDPAPATPVPADPVPAEPVPADPAPHDPIGQDG
ncbi:O-antigen ligase family protein [Plantibacter sp. Mn2098]|uniref:O-antigen ligase family protein n=1 Tax=Plantibacter sp. Mn2098 TaxID=3395266 RepID=UPI003BD6EC37